MKKLWKVQNILTSLYHDQRGNVAMEYALVLPLFLMMTIGGFELGRIYMVNSALEGALTQSTRVAMSGNLPAEFTSRDEYIESIVRTSLDGVGVSEGVDVAMKVYSSFADIGEEEPYVDQNGNGEYDSGECFTDVNDNSMWDEDMGNTGVGGQENIMVMTITVDLPFLAGWLKPLMGERDFITLSGTTAIRNEPFGGVSWEPSSNVICT